MGEFFGEPEHRVRGAIERMWRRRLIMRIGEAYMPVGELRDLQ